MVGSRGWIKFTSLRGANPALGEFNHNLKISKCEQFITIPLPSNEQNNQLRKQVKPLTIQEDNLRT